MRSYLVGFGVWMLHYMVQPFMLDLKSNHTMKKKINKKYWGQKKRELKASTTL